MTTEFEKQLGMRIRSARESAGFSREQLSERANISTKFLYEIESGRKGMSAITLYDLSRALNVSTEYLFTGKTQNRTNSHISALLDSLDTKKSHEIETLLFDILQILS